MTTAVTAKPAVEEIIGALPPIGLPELVQRAALLTRLDRKYIVPLAELPAVLAGMPAGTRALWIDQRHTFGYRSVYFDTPALDSYRAAARRQRQRYKLRVRSYLDADRHFLEVKIRERRGVTAKLRTAYVGDRWRLDRGALAYTDEILTGAGFRRPEPPRPALTTGYRRSTLFVPGCGRVTIDTDLGWLLPGGPGGHLPDRAIVEVKSERTATPVDRLLWSHGHRPCPVSKYATGLAALRPDLPAHRWLPVLRRHFQLVPERG